MKITDLDKIKKALKRLAEEEYIKATIKFKKPDEKIFKKGELSKENTRAYKYSIFISQTSAITLFNPEDVESITE